MKNSTDKVLSPRCDKREFYAGKCQGFCEVVNEIEKYKDMEITDGT